MPPIVVRDASASEQGQVLRMALTEPRVSAEQAAQVSRATQGYLQRCGGAVGGLHLAESAGEVVGVCAGLDLPGAVSLLIVPKWSLSRAAAAVLEDLLAEAALAADRRGRRFAQVLLEAEAARPVRPQLVGAGFHFLANLQYMQRDAFDPASVEPIEGVSWRTLPEAGEEELANVIKRTYIDSRDCAGLTGIRSMEEVLAGHRGAGDFDPAGWYLMRYQGRDVGVVLTARTPARPSLEIAYCGLVPEARGKGLGRLCVHKAIVRARDAALPMVTLAVDAANEPARRMYEAMGFASYASRDVWIRVFRRADEEGAFAWPER